MGPVATRRLLAVHRFTGLVISLNLLVFALTGLVLIFHEEIDDALGVMPRAAASASSVGVAGAIAAARAAHPDRFPVYASQDADEYPGVLFVGMGDASLRFEGSLPVAVDAGTGKVLPQVDFEGSFTGIVLHLHAQLLAGAVGGLVVGLLGFVFLVSLVTGAIVYGPMMKRFVFGLLRRDRHRRTLFADLHKLVGVATFGWTLVVAVTGIFLAFGGLLLQLYASTELAELGRPYAHEPAITDVSTIDAAVAAAEAGKPGRHWTLAIMPGAELASPRHFTVLLEGGEGMDARLATLALVDARAPERVLHREMPWYLKALLLSEPLHFGDYGGLPLKILWALLTLATILLAATGVYVNLSTRRQVRR